ncbi:MAG: hypothetical protein ACKPCM_06825, partial [Pseudanabaena sp.]
PKFTIITAHRNVIAIASNKFTRFSSHGFISMIPIISVGAEHYRNNLSISRSVQYGNALP